jgi:SP family sugar:H+ symporter-like MFS transporter
MASGLVETAVPSFLSDVAPAPLRSMFSGSIVFLVVIGQLWSNLMARAFRFDTTNVGWRVVTGMQIVPVAVVICFLPFTPESPRWLVLHGRKDEALKSLDRIRPQRDVDDGTTILEVDMIELAINESQLTGSGSWLDIFKGNYRRRTCIAMVCLSAARHQRTLAQGTDSRSSCLYFNRSMVPSSSKASEPRTH